MATEAPVHIDADVLVIGAGGAGMYAALAAAEAGAGRVVLVDRNMVGRGGATVMAQMTVAAALGEAEPDSTEEHFEDTLEAGRELCDPGLAQLLCEDGPVRIREMDAWRVGWAREAGASPRSRLPATGAGAAATWTSSTPARQSRPRCGAGSRARMRSGASPASW